MQCRRQNLLQKIFPALFWSALGEWLTVPGFASTFPVPFAEPGFVSCSSLAGVGYIGNGTRPSL
jgi:hypothetical protein